MGGGNCFIKTSLHIMTWEVDYETVVDAILRARHYHENTKMSNRAEL